MILGKFSMFFFQIVPYALGGSPEEFVCRTENPVLPKFQLLEFYIDEIGLKCKKGVTKKWISVLGTR